jgi:hypothetical protein
MKAGSPEFLDFLIGSPVLIGPELSVAFRDIKLEVLSPVAGHSHL